jgi:hypothetical protein
MLHRRSDEFQVQAPQPIDRLVAWRPDEVALSRRPNRGTADESQFELLADNCQATQLLVLRRVQQAGASGVSRADLERWLAEVAQTIDALSPQQRGGFSPCFGRYAGLQAMLNGLAQANVINRSGARYTVSKYTRRLLHLRRESLRARFLEISDASAE